MRVGMAVGGVALLGVAGVIAFGGVNTYVNELFSGPLTMNSTDTVAGVRTIDMENDSGNLTVRGADVDKTTVVRMIRYHGDKPGQTFHSAGSTLTLADCGERCEVDYIVTVPRATAVTGWVTSGDVRVNGVGGVHLTATSGTMTLGQVADVDVKAESGDVSVTDANGPVKVEATSGQVQLKGIGGDAIVNAESGDINATDLHGKIDAEAQSGQVDINTLVPADIKAISHSGDINVRVPRDVQYRVDAHAESGDVHAIPNTPNGRFLITAEAQSGEIHIDQP